MKTKEAISICICIFFIIYGIILLKYGNNISLSHWNKGFFFGIIINGHIIREIGEIMLLCSSIFLIIIYLLKDKVK